MKKLALSLSALAILVACADAPPPTAVGVDEGGASFSGMEIVVTAGAPAPVRAVYVPRRPSLSNLNTTSVLVNGVVTTAVSLYANTCEAGTSQQLQVTYAITGNQGKDESFKVYKLWTYNGSSWSGAEPVTVHVPSRSPSHDPTIREVTITLVNASAVNSGNSTLTIIPFDNTNNGNPNINTNPGRIQANVAFVGCSEPNTPPALALPEDITQEATSSAGAAVTFVVNASDNEDGDLTHAVICTPASGSTFPLGETTVTCTVQDSEGEEATGSFKVTVVDTTPAYFTNFPSGTIELIATDINGALLDSASFGITVADVNGVSEPATFACTPAWNTVLPIGSTTTVSCTATDTRDNESDPSTFDVYVGLNISGTGFLPPLRMAAPFSAHKLNSTIPHKFLPPTYRDGTPATDLADGLRLVLTQKDATPDATSIEANDFATGSTEWRYDPKSGHYIFNLKTDKSWPQGTWTTTVSFQDVVLATTTLDLRK